MMGAVERREPDLSAADVERLWDGIVDDLYRAELDRSNEAWSDLGEQTSELGERFSL